MLFRLTGSFFNPGPYSGYLAVILPVCLWTALRFQKGMRCFGYICVGAILIVLPAGMSRSAWIAAVVACGWVYWTERIGWEKTKAVYRRNKNATIPFIAIVAILAGCAIAGRIRVEAGFGGRAVADVESDGESDSSDSRLQERAWAGFRQAYAEAQGAVFRDGGARPARRNWWRDARNMRSTNICRSGWNRGSEG